MGNMKRYYDLLIAWILLGLTRELISNSGRFSTYARIVANRIRLMTFDDEKIA